MHGARSSFRGVRDDAPIVISATQYRGSCRTEGATHLGFSIPIRASAGQYANISSGNKDSVMCVAKGSVGHALGNTLLRPLLQPANLPVLYRSCVDVEDFAFDLHRSAVHHGALTRRQSCRKAETWPLKVCCTGNIWNGFRSKLERQNRYGVESLPL